MRLALALLLALWPAVAAADLLDFVPLRWIEKRLLYPFERAEVAPEAMGLPGITVRRVRVNGAQVVVWTAPPARPGAPVVLYFHGNGGNLANRAARYGRILGTGYGLVAPSYRGASGSTGRPNERRLTADAQAIFDAIPEWLPTGGPVIVYGESLGAAVSVALMDALPLARRPAGVILEAPFTSIPDMARTFDDVPPNLAARIRDTWASRDRADALTSPLLVIHGTEDELVPFWMGEALYGAAATRDKAFLAVRGAGHIAPWDEQVRGAIRRFIERVGR